MNLTIAISTIGDRINFIHHYKFDDRVNYFILWQFPTDEEFFLPKNVELIKIEGHGVALSRNSAISHTKTSWLWFMDDDVYIPEISISHVMSLIKNANDTDVFIASVKSTEGMNIKKYDLSHSIKIRDVLNVGTIQIISNVSIIKKSKATFPINMGAGTENPLCDEPVFLCRLFKATKNLKFIFPSEVYVIHPLESSGLYYTNAGSARSRAMLFREIYGFPLCIFASVYFLIKNFEKIGFLGIYLFSYRKAK